MGKLLGAVRTLAMLVAVWGVLLGVGWVAGAIPRDTLDSDPRTPTKRPEGADPKERVPRKSPSKARREATTADAGQPEGQPTTIATRIARYPICPTSASEPSVVLMDIVGNPERELTVACGSTVQVLAWTKPEGSQPILVRVATFDVSEAPAGGATHAAVPCAGDVDGDMLTDLVLGFWYLGPDGAPRGGELFFVRRNETGVFDPPRRLGSFAAAHVAVEPLDAVAGSEVVASNRIGTTARRTGELWVFTGGPAPVRTVTQRMSADILDLTVADVNDDTKKDVVIVSSGAPSLSVFLGDGEGRFGRALTLAAPDARMVIAGHLDAQETTNLILQGHGVQLLHARPNGGFETRPIDAPAEISSIQIADMNADSRGDIVGIVHNRIVSLNQVQPLGFHEEELVSFEQGAFTPKRLLVADTDANGKPELILLGRPTASSLNWELMVLPDTVRGTMRAMDTVPKSVLDAPLQLTIALR